MLGGDARSFYHDTVEVFDGSQWKMGTNMLRRRTDFATVIFNNKLYAIGGKRNKNTYCREVEVYDFKEKEWRYAAILNVPELNMARVWCKEKFMLLVALAATTIWICPWKFLIPKIMFGKE